MDRPKCCQIDMEKGREGRRRRKKERKEEKNAKEEEMERKEGESGRSGESVNNARFTKGRDGRINRGRGATPQPLSKQPPRGSVPPATPRKPLPASCQWRRGFIRIDGNLSTGKFADEDSDYELQPRRRRRRHRRLDGSGSSRVEKDAKEETTVADSNVPLIGQFRLLDTISLRSSLNFSA